MSSKIVEEIKNMSVKDLADLIKTLEETFGVSAAAPVAVAQVAVGAAPVAQAEEKSEYEVTLKDAGANKINVIKALRAVTTLALGDAKAAVENTPFVVSKAAPKEEAQKIKKELEAAGAKVDLS